MPLPKMLRIAGYDVRVQVEDSEDFTDEYHGVWEPRFHRIRLSSTSTRSQGKETLLHEVLHAVSDAYSSELDEHQVTTIARGLFATFADNPKLLAYLAE